MARTILPLLASQFIVFFILSSFVTEATRTDHGLVKRLDPKLYGLGKEKLSHFRLYWYDVVSGNNPTAVPVVPPVNLTAGTGFGTITIIDDPLTEGSEISSKMVGRAQGLYAMASREEIVALMSMNFAFPGGKYNGSTITVVGRNSVNSKVREMPVIGGSGMFRFARGYVEARTHTFDKNTGDAIVEYTCYVLHH